MNPIRFRHAYLHDTLAGDSEHVVAAATELRAHKNTQGFQAGHLFVDSAQAMNTTRAILFEEMRNLKAGQTWQQLSQSGRKFQKFQDLNHAATNLVDLSDPNANALLRGPQDKLYVKGHGSSTNNQSISTIVRSKERVNVNQNEWRKESLTVRHQIQDVASGVMNVGEKLGQNHLDVRLTSCGSAGAYEFDTKNDTIKGTGGRGVAGTLSRELLHRDANTIYSVHGYRGSSNSTTPRSVPQQGRHFQTTVKFHNLDHQNLRGIPLQPFTQTFGQSPALSVATRKVTSNQNESIAPLNPGMSDKINRLNTLRGPNPDNTIKRTQYEDHDKGIAVTMRRRDARIKV